MGGNKLPENMFHVINIGDDRRLDKGMMQVTDTELIFTDRKTTEYWRWPLKFLRKYGCDGEVFSFEAGRKCPGGEGLYAFESKRASHIFDMVARNINQGGLHPPAGELSPFPSESHPPDQNTLVSRHSISQSPGHTHTDQPNYANMDLQGNHLLQMENGGLEPALPQRPVAYKEVVFDRPPEQHPVPQGEREPRTSYTKIDFEGTESYNRERRLGTLHELPPFVPVQGRTSTSSVSSQHAATTDRVGGRRGRMHTYSGPGGSAGGRLPSDSSFSSQGSLTDIPRDIRPSQSSLSSGAAAHSSLAVDAQSSGTALYQNVFLTRDGSSVPAAAATSSPAPQQQYQNVTVGAGTVDRVFDNPTSSSTPQPMTNGGGGGGHSTSRSASTSHGAGMTSGGGSGRNGISPIVVNGNPMAHYADLELGNSAARRRATSTPVGNRPPPNLSYSVMDFPAREGRSSPNHLSSTVVPYPSSGGDSSPPNRTPNGDIRGRLQLRSASSCRQEEPVEVMLSPSPLSAGATMNGDAKKLQDETKVEYGVLNFPAMEVLAKTKPEHLMSNERDIQGTSSRKGKK